MHRGRAGLPEDIGGVQRGNHVVFDNQRVARARRLRLYRHWFLRGLIGRGVGGGGRYEAGRDGEVRLETGGHVTGIDHTAQFVGNGLFNDRGAEALPGWRLHGRAAAFPPGDGERALGGNPHIDCNRA